MHCMAQKHPTQKEEKQVEKIQNFREVSSFNGSQLMVPTNELFNYKGPPINDSGDSNYSTLHYDNVSSIFFA